MKEKGWRDIPDGGLITEAGNAANYITGGWRAFRPVRDKEKCTNCLICWACCPDSAIRVKDGKLTDIDLDHCKGCGICARECPKKIIKMVPESEFNK